MDHLECEDLMVPLDLLENQELLERMVHPVSQEVRVTKETLGHPGRREALAWMVPEEMRASQESPEKEAK